jgi:hypothetical protein
MYYHVIENTMRNGVRGYRLVKTYKNWKALDKWLRKEGRPLWVESSNRDHLVVNGGVYGGFTASYWNTGGWASAVMPKLPMHSRF